MEASAKIVLKCVCLLGMLVLSLASAPTPRGVIDIPDTSASAPAPRGIIDIPNTSASAPAPRGSIDIPNTSTWSCAAKCGISCGLSIEDPPVYLGCFSLCMISCKIPATSTDEVAVYGCTRSCVSSVRKAWTPTSTKPSDFDLKSYAQGYVDSCFYGCSKNNELF